MGTVDDGYRQALADVQQFMAQADQDAVKRKTIAEEKKQWHIAHQALGAAKALRELNQAIELLRDRGEDPCDV